jgi:hypothetical protein
LPVNKITEHIGSFHAETIDVRCAGGVTRLLFETKRGKVSVDLAEHKFVGTCRGDRDSGGHPFRTLEQIRKLELRASPLIEVKSVAAVPEAKRDAIMKPGGFIL